MPFGLCNAPATFQRLMDLVLAGLQWSHCLVYLDDIIVGRSLHKHLHNLQAVFTRLRKAGLKLNPSKCSLLQTEVQYLGYVVTQEGVSVDPSKIETVQTWPEPQCSISTLVPGFLQLLLLLCSEFCPNCQTSSLNDRENA